MCRHFAYVGGAQSLRALLMDPPFGLDRQAWAPRLQRHGTVNADGFGIGWYAEEDPVPARYRRGVPIWADPSLPDLARVIRSRAVLAAVRSATPGSAAGAQAAAPFGADRWLFSHNGSLHGWPGSAGSAALPLAVEALLPVEALLSVEAMVDSAFLWAMVLDRLSSGVSMPAALVSTITAIEAAGGTGRFNFLLTDGRSIAATACGDTLWYRRRDGAAASADGPITAESATAESAAAGPITAGPATAESVMVASEPVDDKPGWTEVPDRHVLTATPSAVSVAPFAPACHDGIEAAVRTEGIVTL